MPSPRIDPDVLARLSVIVGERLGMRIDPDHVERLSALLAKRLKQSGTSSAGAYVESLASPSIWAREEASLAEALTVGESHFFRVPDHFRAFDSVTSSTPGRLRIASLGCARGEEAYTAAIVLAERGVDGLSRDVQIIGADVNRAVLEKARQARYPSWALRQTPDAIRSRYFRKDGGEYSLIAPIRRMVSFQEANILDGGANIWMLGPYDVIFCRNVTIYFSQEATRDLIARIARALAPNGYLFIGHSESLRGISTEFTLRHTHDTFYYQLGSTGTAAPEPSTSSAQDAPRIRSTNGRWIEAIQASAQRIERLSALRREREAPLEAQPHEPIDQLATAVALAERGEAAAADEICDRLIREDGHVAAAHHLKAICAEHSGDLAAARSHYEITIFLDPAFAMAHLHLGLLARKGGDFAAAKRWLERALALIAGEDPVRIRLFGGGFTREGLKQMCRAELALCGGER